MEDSDEDGDDFPVRLTGKRATQSQKPARTVKKKAPSPEEEDDFQPLFLSDDDEDKMAVDDEEEIVIDVDEGTSTLRSTRGSHKTQPPKPRKKAPVPIIIDDDSDDGATFKGFGSKVKTRSRR